MMRLSTKRISSRTLISVVSLVLLAAPFFPTARGNRPVDQTFFVQKQTARVKSVSAPTPRDVYSWAKEAQEKLPPVEFWDKARTRTNNDRSVVRLIRKGDKFVKQVIARGPGMSAWEAASYDAQMRKVLSQIDYLTSGENANGPAGCMGGCDNTYPGWGGGRGWNRFWCKVACIKVRVGPA